jgi:hypothetical protein
VWQAWERPSSCDLAPVQAAAVLQQVGHQQQQVQQHQPQSIAAASNAEVAKSGVTKQDAQTEALNAAAGVQGQQDGGLSVGRASPIIGWYGFLWVHQVGCSNQILQLLYQLAGSSQPFGGRDCKTLHLVCCWSMSFHVISLAAALSLTVGSLHALPPAHITGDAA